MNPKFARNKEEYRLLNIINFSEKALFILASLVVLRMIS